METERPWGWNDAIGIFMIGAGVSGILDLSRFGADQSVLYVLEVHAFAIVIGSCILGSMKQYRKLGLRVLPYLSPGLGAGAGLGAYFSDKYDLLAAIGIGVTGALACLLAAMLGWWLAGRIQKIKIK